MGASHMSKGHLMSPVKETKPEQASRVSQRAPELLNPSATRRGARISNTDKDGGGGHATSHCTAA